MYSSNTFQKTTAVLNKYNNGYTVSEMCSKKSLPSYDNRLLEKSQNDCQSGVSKCYKYRFEDYCDSLGELFGFENGRDLHVKEEVISSDEKSVGVNTQSEILPDRGIYIDVENISEHLNSEVLSELASFKTSCDSSSNRTAVTTHNQIDSCSENSQPTTCESVNLYPTHSPILLGDNTEKHASNENKTAASVNKHLKHCTNVNTVCKKRTEVIPGHQNVSNFEMHLGPEVQKSPLFKRAYAFSSESSSTRKKQSTVKKSVSKKSKKSISKINVQTPYSKERLAKVMETCSYAIVSGMYDECPLGHALLGSNLMVDIKTGIAVVFCPPCGIDIIMDILSDPSGA